MTPMKTSIAFLTLFLLLAHVQAAPSSSVAVGTLVTVSGNINGVNAYAGGITLEYEHNIYFVTVSSFLTVNGKRGNLSYLAQGMKVTGSAEVAQGDSRSAPQKKIIMMLAATTTPSSVRPVAAS